MITTYNSYKRKIKAKNNGFSDKIFKNTSGGTLTGLEIYNQVKNGNIQIDPFNIDQINPNSYNLRLAPVLKVYKEYTLDFKKKNETINLEIPKTGFVMQPGTFYLGSTIERTFTNKFVPIINGRSSGGRLGLSIHETAGFGDIGFNGQWTLEITVNQPLVIYPEIEIAQVSFQTVYGDPRYQYTGRYQDQFGVVQSKSEEKKNYSISNYIEEDEMEALFYEMCHDEEYLKTLSIRWRSYISNMAYTYDINRRLYEGEDYCLYSYDFNEEEYDYKNNHLHSIAKDGKIVGRVYYYKNTSFNVRNLNIIIGDD